MCSLVAFRQRRMDGGFFSGLVPEAVEVQLHTIARYNPPEGNSVNDFLQLMLRLGDFAWELRNHRLEQLLRAPHRAAARVHRWLTAAEGDCPPPPPRCSRDFVASLRLVNRTLECPTQEDPDLYGDLPGGFSKHLRGTLFPPWVIGRNSMTALEAHVAGADWTRECSPWCATTRIPGTPAAQYAAIPPATHPTAAHGDWWGGP